MNALADYFVYEREIGRTRLAQIFREKIGMQDNAFILDVGCGYGGVLQGLGDVFPTLLGIGIDRDLAMIQSGQPKMDNRFSLKQIDFYEMNPIQCDIILLRDVLEHIGDYPKAILHANSFLKPGGYLYASVAPFFGPFGGHQHNGSGLFAKIPWIHLLPKSWFFRLVPVTGNSYKEQTSLLGDIVSVFETHLTLQGFEKAAKHTGLFEVWKQGYFSRPEYKFKFGWPTVAIPNIPWVGELLTTGLEVLYKKPA